MGHLRADGFRNKKPVKGDVGMKVPKSVETRKYGI